MGSQQHRPHVIVDDISELHVHADAQRRVRREINPQAPSANLGVDLYERAVNILSQI